MDLHFTMYGRDIEFSMHYDENFAADRNMLYCLQRLNACEPEVMHVMARTLRPGDYAVDAGANIGFFTLFMSLLVGEEGGVLSCEPAPANQIKLEANLKLNRITNAATIYSPLWSVDNESVKLHVAEDSGVNSLRPNVETIGAIKCRTVTLNALLRLKIPRLIKIDVEGAEQHVIEGLGDLLGEVPYIICELNEPALGRFGHSRESLRLFMRNYYYEMFVLPPDGILPVLIPPNTRLVSEKNNLNVLFSTVEAVAEAYPEIEVN